MPKPIVRSFKIPLSRKEAEDCRINPRTRYSPAPYIGVEIKPISGNCQLSRAQMRTDVPSKQARIVAEVLGTRPWRGTDVEPMIEILTNGLSGRKAVATKIPLREHAVEVGSCGPQPSTNEFADELATPGIPVATNVDADQPFAWPTANDLTNLADHFCLLRRICGPLAAHDAAA